MKKLADDEAAQLLERLRNIEEEEAERLKFKRLRQINLATEAEKYRIQRKAEMEAERYKQTQYRLSQDCYSAAYNSYRGPYAFDSLPSSSSTICGDFDLLGFSEQEIDLQCAQLFASDPIQFKPRRGNELDEKVAEQLQLLETKIPVLWIKADLYLIGCKKFNLSIKRDLLLIKVGGGFEKFEEYV